MYQIGLVPKSRLQAAAQEIAERYNLATLPEHAHQIVNACISYFALHLLISPILSPWLVPRLYGQLPRRTKINWNIRVVSLVQATFICASALHVIKSDPTRYQMEPVDRLWKYSPSSGSVQAFAAGYFIWDLFVSIWYLKTLGVGSLIHAICALLITMMGFRPFANYYGINFILYELSTPFLNFHWFMDKVGMTGSSLQFANGICLLISFFGCRIAWGTYQSIKLYRDAISVLSTPLMGDCIEGLFNSKVFISGVSEHTFESCKAAAPSWLLVVFVVANTMLSVLNVYWFGLMLQALQRRLKGEKPKTS